MPAFCVDLTCASAYATLGALHLDHEQDLVVRHVGAGARSPTRPPRGTARCCALSVRDDPAHGPAMLRFRCVHGRHGARHCHKLNMPHYRGLRDVGLAPS